VAEGEYEPVAVRDSLKKSKAYAPLPPIVDSEPEDKKADHYNRQTFSNKLYFDDNDDLYENTRLEATKHNTTKTVFTNSSAIQDKSDDMNAMESLITKDQTEQKKILVNRSSSYVEDSSSFQNELKLTLSNLKPVCRAKSTLVHEKREDETNNFSVAESADTRGQKIDEDNVGARPKIKPFIDVTKTKESSSTGTPSKPKPAIKPKPTPSQSQTKHAEQNQSLQVIKSKSQRMPCTTESQHKQMATIAPMTGVKQLSQKIQNVPPVTSTHDRSSVSLHGHTDDASIVLPDSNSLDALPTVHSVEDVKRLSVSEVAAYIRVLNLASYATEFIAQSVDGMLLTQLQKEEIERDFGMKGVEARRLVNFSQKAHIPRH